MNQRIKTLVAVTALAVTASAATNVEACNRGGRRISLSRGPLGFPGSPYANPRTRIRVQPSLPPPVVYQQPVVCTTPAPAPPAAVKVERAPQPATSIDVAQVNGVNPSAIPNTIAASPAGSNPNAASNDAEASALQLLASISDGQQQAGNSDSSTESQIPQFSPASPAPAAGHVGKWSVQLPGNQTVELVLNADGSFQWTATKNGNSSRFQGQYRLESNRLTLVRSNDLQQMAGSWTGIGANFTFKLDGASNGGLNFTRQ